MLIYSIIGVILCVFSLTVYADYDCLCNYRVETPMYSAQDVNSRPAGYMYEFDCKPAASTSSVQETWTAIINEHFIAYVEKGSGLQMQVCQGGIPDEDKLFTSTKQASTTTTTTTPKPTTTSSTTTSLKPTTASTTTTTPKPTTASTSTTTPKPTATSTTTTPKPTATSTITTTSNPTTTITQPTTPSTTTTTKPTTTSTTTTPKPTTASTTSTTPKPTTTSSTSSWSTTSDWLIHWNSTHFPFTTKKPHQTTHSHITTRKPHHTTDWLIHWNNTHSPFTSQPPSQLSNSHGNMKLCPGILTRTNDAKWLRQYKDYCYEFVGHAMNWYDAEADCWQRLGHGGELLEIYTQDIQHYITNFLQEINNHRYIWIGLQDIDREEHFSWDSGARLTYKNWKPDRKGNHLPHGREDCVMMLTNGLWDDALCSHDIRRRFLVNANNINVRRPFICQYPIRSSHHG